MADERHPLDPAIVADLTGYTNAAVVAETAARVTAVANEAAARDAAIAAAGVTNFGNGGVGIMRTVSAPAVAASVGTLDLDTGATSGISYAGILIVENIDNTNAGNMTQTVFAVMGRGGVIVATSLATRNGVTLPAAFTITTPAAGVIRLTNTYAANPTVARMTYIGNLGI